MNTTYDPIWKQRIRFAGRELVEAIKDQARKDFPTFIRWFHKAADWLAEIMED